MTKLAFVDCETTGLDPERHVPWEIAIILRDGGEDQEYVVRLAPPSWALEQGDEAGLRIGGWWSERATLARAGSSKLLGRSTDEWLELETDETRIARTVAFMLAGAHLVGAVVSFDAAMLTAWLRANGQPAPVWHYHLVDVEALVAGKFGAGPPWNSADLTRMAGVELPSPEDRHTALGDARWARDLFDSVVGQGVLG